MLATTPPVFMLDQTRLNQSFDSQNTKDLHTMWSVFSKASEVLEHGKRLEYLSWRLWNREALCCAPRTSQSAPSRSRLALASRPIASDLPTLSSSADSYSSIDDDSSSRKYHPANRARTSYPKPLDIQSLVTSIKEKQELTAPLSPLPPPSTDAASDERSRQSSRATAVPASRPCSPRRRITNTESSTSTVATTAASFNSDAASSNTSADSTGSSSHSVVRGFTPGSRSSYASKTQLAPAPTPILKTSSSSSSQQGPRKSKTLFQLGGSSGEDDSSLRDNMSPPPQARTASTDQGLVGSGPCSKKQTSFNEQVTEIRTKPPKHSKVFETDTDSEDDDEQVSESAIDEDDDDDDDDDDAWEDDDSVEPKEETKPINFQRIDSSTNVLTSRKSQLALDLQKQRSHGNLGQALRSAPALRRSRTSTPNGPSMPASPQEESPLGTRVSEQAQPKPIATTTNTNQQVSMPALSPRTTRRNMLAGELSESFRKQMIWERQQRNVYTTQAPLKRAHTSVDVRTLDASDDTTAKAPPKDDAPQPAQAEKAWNKYFDGGSGGYHVKGW